MRGFAWTALTLLLPLAVGCSDDKDPMNTTASQPTTPGTSQTEGGESGEEGSTSGVTTSDGGSDSQTSASTATTASTSATSATSASTSATSASTSATTASTTEDPSTTGPMTMTDPSTTTTQTTDPSTTTTTGDPDEAATQLCVDTINMYRATLGLPPYQRWTDAEACSDSEAQMDGNSGVPHGAFGMCGEFAQNECPGWPAPPEGMIESCLAQMWAEGPGDFPEHGHYINMSSTDYTRVACGFAIVNGEVWAVQNFQ